METEITDYIQQGNFTAAADLLHKMPKQNYTVTTCILAATTYLALEQFDLFWAIMQLGFKFDPNNYELYLILGQYYELTNMNQAYLCYENAYFHCAYPQDQAIIKDFMNNAKKHSTFHVVPTSIVILSYEQLDYTKECIQSIQDNNMSSTYEIVVVDNHSSEPVREWLKSQDNLILQLNDENKGFPIGCNQGIALAKEENDIFLLNNDTILTPNALFTLRMGLYSQEKQGACGSITNCAVNGQAIQLEPDTKEQYLAFGAINNIPLPDLMKEKLWLVGFALLIKRTALNEVGLLDPAFSPGTYEDNDLCMRLTKADFHIGLCHNSFIYHYGGGGNPKNRALWAEVEAKNRQTFLDKWGYLLS